MTFYTVLGITADADDDSVRNAWRTLARRYHPDAGPGSCPEKFRRVAEAYETLGDPDRRRVYDRSLGRAGAFPAEPMTAQQRYYGPRFHGPLDELFDDLFRSLAKDPFFGDLWRW